MLKTVSRLAMASAAIIGLAACADSPSRGGSGGIRDWDEVKASGVLRWGGDEAGGTPYQFRDPQDPSLLIGFEVEIADEIARRLGLKAEFIQTNWPQIIPALQRGNMDTALSGIEVTPERQAQVDFTRPYYYFTQQIVVRKGTQGIIDLESLKGRKVGTLGATAAERLMNEAGGIEVRPYDDNVTPYQDLAIGRLDAVLLDLPIAVHHGKPNEQLEFAGEPFAPGQYAAVVHQKAPKLRAELDRTLGEMIADGTLRRILEKWELWNDSQNKL